MRCLVCQRVTSQTDLFGAFEAELRAFSGGAPGRMHCLGTIPGKCNAVCQDVGRENFNWEKALARFGAETVRRRLMEWTGGLISYQAIFSHLSSHFHTPHSCRCRGPHDLPTK